MTDHVQELKKESSRLRNLIIQQAALDGGHVGPPLGAVEIIQALVHVYDFPKDKMFFDVGHQMHAYKLLTDRADRFHLMNKKNGISEFPNPHESIFDFYTGGHSGLAISSALGYAVNHPEYKSIALIGDGSMTGGQPYEALNHAGELAPNILVIYNDNDYSITKTTGFLSSHKRLQSFSESLGFKYVGIVDGHNIEDLIDELTQAKNKKYPVFMHVKTIKGKGFEPAEKEPVAFHDLAPFNTTSGTPHIPKNNSFGEIVIEKTKQLKEKYPNLYLTSPAAARSSGLRELHTSYPNHVIDTGMNEQHCVTFSASIAMNHNKVICFIPATFLPRALDQLIDVCLLKVPIVFVVLNPGIAATGPTHQGIYTFPLLHMLPNIELLNPTNLEEFSTLLEDSLEKDHPVFIQKPTENITGIDSLEPLRVVNEGTDLTILSLGNTLNKALHAVEAFSNIQVIQTLRIIPFDVDGLRVAMGSSHKLLILEDGLTKSGVGEHIVSRLSAETLESYQILGVNDRFPSMGSLEEVYEDIGLSDVDVLDAIEQMLEQ